MKVRQALKLYCKYCKYTKIKRVLQVRCIANPRHKQR